MSQQSTITSTDNNTETKNMSEQEQAVAQLILNSTGTVDVLNERVRQISKGYTPEHDGQHPADAMYRGALAYMCVADGRRTEARHVYPFAGRMPAVDARTAMVRAAALLLAAVDQHDAQLKGDAA